MQGTLAKHFGLLMLSGLFFSFTFPSAGVFLQPYLQWILMGSLFITFVQIDSGHSVRQLSMQVPLVLLVLCWYMLVSPVLVFFAAYGLDSDIRLGLLLLAAVPCAATAPVLSGAFGGDSHFSALLTVLSYVVAAVSIPFLFYSLAGTQLNFISFYFVLNIVMIFALPMLAAQLFRACAISTVGKLSSSLSTVNLFLVMIIAYSALSGRTDAFFEHPKSTLFYVFLVLALFVGFFVLSYLLFARVSRGTRISIATGKTFMNSAFALVLSSQYFSAETTVLVVMSQIPWMIMPGVFQWVLSARVSPTIKYQGG